MTKTETIIVVLGLDADKKPRAAKFDVADEKTVRKAAAAQGLKIGRPKTDEATELALRLVDGKIYSSGKGLMPLVNAETYEKLLKLLEIEDPKADAATVKVSPAPGKPVTASVLIPDPWFKIAVGAAVLCRDTSNKDGGWWECTVGGVSKDSKLLTVRWANFPTMKAFTVKRAAVAILPSKG
jgi:hypothetical protein